MHPQLTQKKSALQFKTLDSVLQTYNRDTGAKQAITYRCADMDRMVPSLMGVSKVRKRMHAGELHELPATPAWAGAAPAWRR